MPVPARPEKLLEATYGPGWRTPDPAFQFVTPERTVRGFNDWFRGTQPGSRFWARRASATAGNPLRPDPTPLARRALTLARELHAEVLDVGAGRGTDALFLARQGVPVTVYDYTPKALEQAQELARQEGLPYEVRFLNLTEWRSVLAEGARLAHRPTPRVVVARHVLDATSAVGRESLARLCSMALRSGGRLLTEFFPSGAGESDDRLEWMMGHPTVDGVTALLRDAGAMEVRVRHLKRGGRHVVRMLGEW
jgi:SAM-dependent methyltransferase